MNNIDSVKLQFNSDLIRFNTQKFNKTIKEIEDSEIISFHLKTNEKKTGIKNIIINDNNCIVEMSSKLYPELYSKMININTVESYLNKIKQYELISFDTYPAIENAEILNCDITDNLEVKGKVKDYIDSLAIYKLNNKYKCNYYLSESIIFERDVKTNSLKEKVTIYNKYPELRLKRNSGFANEINIEDYKNILRIESRFLNFELMRNHFNVSNLKLLSVLNSKEKVNYKIIEKITDVKNIDIKIFNNYNKLIEMKRKTKYSKLRNIAGDISILHSCNYDIDLVKLFFKTNSTANNSKYIRYMKELINSVKQIESKNTISEKVSEIKKLLLVA